MNNKGSSMLHWLWLSGLVLMLDQVSKWIAVQSVQLFEQIIVCPVFSITLAYNTGAAFSFLSEGPGWQRWFLSSVAMLVSVILVSWLRRLKKYESLQACALALILGGALGNLYDRMAHGYVVDFILLHYDRYYFPAFNLADSAITLGSVLLLLDMFRAKRCKRK